MSRVCTPKSHGGLNILNIHHHVIARKAALLFTYASQKQPWTQMMAFQCEQASTKAFGRWKVSHWEVVFGHFVGRIKGCPYTSHLLSDFKKASSGMLWNGRQHSNSLRSESLYWSAAFEEPLGLKEPR